MCFFWSLLVVSAVAKQLKAGCCFYAIEIFSTQIGEQSVMLIRNESFLSEFIGVFITERNTHSGRPFLPVQCERCTALIFVWILFRSEGSIEKDRKGHKYLFLQANCCLCKGSPPGGANTCSTLVI